MNRIINTSMKTILKLIYSEGELERLIEEVNDIEEERHNTIEG